MPPPPTPVELPVSYEKTPFTEIRLSHHPSGAPSVTPIIILTLYRPDAHNAFTNTMMSELEEAYKMFNVDDRVKCIVHTGHGRMFCAGADLKVGLKTEEGEREIEHRDG